MFLPKITRSQNIKIKALVNKKVNAWTKKFLHIIINFFIIKFTTCKYPVLLKSQLRLLT